MPATGSGTRSGSSGPACNAIAIWNQPAITDDCTNVSVNVTDQNGTVVSSGDTFDEGTSVITYTATDLCGNSSICEFNIVVECGMVCNVPPVVTCPQNSIVCIGGDISTTALGLSLIHI